ncbi:MAG: MoaD/ThiS family protein [Hydrogenothermaceae bacterium]|nr:MoaD/ThiS family protein [Hydrogenothermaceae bacterium]
MQITVVYRGQKKVLEFEKAKVKSGDILKALDLSKDFAFVIKNGEIVSEDEIIRPRDEVRVINAISGGAF